MIEPVDENPGQIVTIQDNGIWVDPYHYIMLRAQGSNFKQMIG